MRRRKRKGSRELERSRIFLSMAVGSIVLLLGAGLFVATLGTPGNRFAKCGAASAAGGAALIGGPFTLVDETGQTVTEKQVITRASLVYFGYTSCPDVCPLDSARNAEAVDILAGLGHDVQPVLISVDPDRDTPAVLAAYTDLLHPDMLGLTGSPDQVRAAARAYKIYYQKQDGGDETYLMEHSAFTYLVFPDTGFAEFYRGDVSAAQMAGSVACFMDRAG